MICDISGYLIGSFCAVSGVLVIAFTVPSIVNNFLLFYNHVQYEKKERLKPTPEQTSQGNKERLKQPSSEQSSQNNKKKLERHISVISMSATTDDGVTNKAGSTKKNSVFPQNDVTT